MSSDKTNTSAPVYLLANYEEQISQRLSNDDGLSAYLQDHKLGNIPFCKKQDYEDFKKPRKMPWEMMVPPPPSEYIPEELQQQPQETVTDFASPQYSNSMSFQMGEPVSNKDYIPNTSNFYGESALALVKGHWQTESLDTQTYYGVKQAGDTTSASYTFLFVEEVVTLVPITIKPNKANQTYVISLDGTSLPFSITNVSFELLDAYDDNKKTSVKHDIAQGKETKVVLQAPLGIDSFSNLSVRIATCDFDFARLPSHAIIALPTKDSLEKASKGPAIVSVYIGRVWSDE